MQVYNRRKFLYNASALAGVAFAAPLMGFKNATPKLSFSTLGCPDWTFKQITDFAVANNYTGLEIRGILREMDLPKCPDFKKENIAATKSMMADKKLSFVNLGSSATLHFKDANERQKNIDAAKQFIDLAQELNCPYIRVFPNNFPKEQSKDETMELISSGLTTLGEYAKGSKVTVLMEKIFWRRIIYLKASS